MTQRTESNPPTSVELATADVIATLRAAIEAAHKNHDLAHAVKGFTFTLPEFKKMLALYFHDKTLIDWAHDFGFEPTDNDRSATPDSRI